VGTQGRIRLGHLQWVYPADHALSLSEFDYEDLSTLGTPSGVRDTGPISYPEDGCTAIEFRIHTGTFPGNASLLIRTILLIKFIAAVLHSRASRWKWSSTSKVNAVEGCIKLAGKSLARRSCTYGSGALAHRHHFIERLNIPVDETMIRLDLGRYDLFCPEG
jgi:hypothetical protein